MGELEVPLVGHCQLTLPPPVAHSSSHHCPPGFRPPTGQPCTLPAVRERDGGGGSERGKKVGKVAEEKEREEEEQE